MLLALFIESGTGHAHFDAVYSRYKKRMLGIAHGILNDWAMAEDAVSEAFIRIYKNMHKVESTDSNRTAAFVATIVKNAALTALRRERGYRFAEPDENLPSDFNTEETVEAKLTAENAAHALQSLGEELRGVFVLKFAYGLSHKEIGKLLNISENNVTVRLHRARKKIAEVLAKEGAV